MRTRWPGSYSIWGLLIIGLMLFFSIPADAQSTCPGSAPARLQVGEQAMVLPDAGINLRSSGTADSPILEIVPGGAYLRVTSGPVCNGGFTWWQVEWQEMAGWVAESFDEQTYYLEPIRTFDAQNGTMRLSAFPELAQGVQSAVIQSLQDDQSPRFNASTGLQFILEGYPYPGTAATITAYNTTAMRAINPNAGDILDALRSTLDNRPPTTDLVLLPGLPVTVDIVTQIGYVDFIDGSGIRAIIVLSMEREKPLPPTQDNMAFAFYLFQGLDITNTTYIQALLPLSSELLPVSAPNFDPDAPNAEQQRTQLIRDLETELSQVTLSPSIDVYDRMMASLYTSATPAPIAVQTERYTYGNALYLDYPTSVAEGIELNVLNPAPERRMPRYLELSLVNYPVIDFLHPPVIRIYRVSDVQLARNEEAVAAIDIFKNILLTKPTDLSGLTLPLFSGPIQPPLDTPAYVRFHSGSGVVYITSMTESGQPVESRDLLFVFQGMTNDSEFYVQGLFPLASAAFQQPTDDPASIIATLLDVNYTPDLSLLRMLMTSLQISPTN